MSLVEIRQTYPLRLVDKVLELEVTKRAVCLKNVSFNEKVLCGHFSDEPIFPGVYLVEGLCQTAQIMWQTEKAVTAKLEKFRFKRKVVPGDQVVFEVQVTDMVDGFLMAKGTAKVDGQVVMTGEITGRQL